MIQDLSEAFTDRRTDRDDQLEKILQQMKIRIIGHGMKKDVIVERIENYVLPSFLLVYYCRGEVDISHAGQTTHIAAGSFYLHEPFEIYSGIRTSREPLEFLYVNFDIMPVFIQRIFKHNAFLSGDQLFQKPWYGRMGENMLDFCRMDQTPNPYEEALLEHIIQGIAAYILYDQLQHSPSASLVNDSKESLLIDKVFAYTEQNMSSPIDIGHMLQTFGMSRSTLYRIFLRNMDISPFKAITQFKLERSIELMQKGCPVTEAARLLGYSSAYHFSNSFKAVMGKRPTEYMKKIASAIKKPREH